MSVQTTEQFWKRYLKSLSKHHLHRDASYIAWGFGDSPEMADELGQLVYQGVKTATASLLWEYEYDGEPLPKVSDLSIVRDGGGCPLCIIETTEVKIVPFNQVDARFAHDEGEGDGSLNYWRSVHWSFFCRHCQRIGRESVETMPVVCERFHVVFRV